MLRKYLAAVAIFAMTSAAIADAIEWRTPTYARPGQAFEGTVVGLTDATLVDVMARPTEDGIMNEVHTGGPELVHFSFRVPENTDEEEVRLLVEENSAKIIAKRLIPIVQPQEFDITGDAAIELVYDVKGLNGRAIFVPCCTIYSGMLTAFMLDVNPVGNGTGLPEHLETPFTVMEPDDLAATTSGLALELNYGEPPAEGLVPAVMGYNKHTSQWEPIEDAEHDEENKNLHIQCPNGGFFVIGWLPKPTP